MKKIIVCLLLMISFSGCTSTTKTNKDEMKIPYDLDLSKEDGADSVERDGNHEDSPYFTNQDYYQMESTDTLTILSKFKTMQQTSEWSCGVTSSLMVLEYYGMLGEHNEETLAMYRSNELAAEATSLADIIKIFEGVGGFTMHSTYDYSEEEKYEEITLEMIQSYLKKDIPVMVAWNDWGGHWQVIIGYDTMGTETTQDDVIIMADPYDTTDHNQDGYVVYPAERFYYNWTMYDFFEDNYDIAERDLLFFVAEKN
ncbi:MAG: C39 family peptidase [Coprobacillaceae bacterium]